MVSVLQSAAARGAFKYVQGECYRTAAEEYAKLSRAITVQRYEMIPETANGIPCTKFRSRETRLGMLIPMIPSLEMGRCSNLFADGQLLYKLVPL